MLGELAPDPWQQSPQRYVTSLTTHFRTIPYAKQWTTLGFCMSPDTEVAAYMLATGKEDAEVWFVQGYAQL